MPLAQTVELPKKWMTFSSYATWVSPRKVDASFQEKRGSVASIPSAGDGGGEVGGGTGGERPCSSLPTLLQVTLTARCLAVPMHGSGRKSAASGEGCEVPCVMQLLVA